MARTGSIPSDLDVPTGYCVRRKADNSGWEAYNPAGAQGPPGPPGQDGADGAPGTTDWNGITNKPPTFPPDSHNHDANYYTKAQVDSSLAGKSNTNHTHALTYVQLPNDTLAMDFANNNAVKLTVTANRTLTTTVPAAGHVRHIMVLTSGTTSRTITFGAGFKPTGTLATGTVSARIFVIAFVSDGVNLYEQSRTVAIVA